MFRVPARYNLSLINWFSVSSSGCTADWFPVFTYILVSASCILYLVSCILYLVPGSIQIQFPSNKLVLSFLFWFYCRLETGDWFPIFTCILYLVSCIFYLASCIFFRVPLESWFLPNSLNSRKISLAPKGMIKRTEII